MATLPTLVPTSDNSISGITDQSGGTTNLYATIDEGISAFNDADYITTANNLSGQFEFTNMPTDFLSMTSMTVTGRCRITGWADDDHGIRCRIYKSGTGTLLAQGIIREPITNSAFTTFGPIAMTSVDTAATKAEWDAADLWIDFLINAINMGNDNATKQLSAIEFNGVYVVASAERSFGGLGVESISFPGPAELVIGGWIG